MNFLKVIIKLFLILAFLIMFIGGSIFLSYKFLKGDYNIAKSITQLIENFKDKPRVSGVLLGTDKGGFRTDFIMVVSYDPNNNKIDIISIPRDTKISGSVDKKINSLYIKGNESDVLTGIRKIINLDIEYYAVVNFEGFRKIVDQVGGIPMNVPINMKYYDPYQNLNIDIKKGYQVLDGKNAEGFVRFRSGYSNGDLGRIKAQQEFVKSAINQFLKPSNIPKIPSIINIVLKNVKTNVPKTEILKYADDAAKIKSENISFQQLPGQPKYIGGVSCFIHDPQKTKLMIDEIIYSDADEVAIFERNKNYTLEVLNGTDIAGLAQKTATELREKGFNVKRIGNSNSSSENTKIINRNSNLYGEYIKTYIKVGEISSNFLQNSDVDVTIILGEDANNEE